MDASRIIPAQELLYARRRHPGIEEHLAATCPACGAADADTRYARVCHKAGAQVNQHQPFVRSTSPSWSRCPSATKWKAVRPLTRQGLMYGKSLSRGEASETRRYRISSTNAYSSTSPTRTPRREFTCVPEVLTKMDELLPLLKVRQCNHYACPGHVSSTSAAINLSP